MIGVMEIWIAQFRRVGNRISELAGRSEAAPVPAMDADRRVDLAHHHGFAGADVSFVRRPEQSAKENATSIPATFLHVRMLCGKLAIW